MSKEKHLSFFLRSQSSILNGEKPYAYKSYDYSSKNNKKYFSEGKSQSKKKKYISKNKNKKQRNKRNHYIGIDLNKVSGASHFYNNSKENKKIFKKRKNEKNIHHRNTYYNKRIHEEEKNNNNKNEYFPFKGIIEKINNNKIKRDKNMINKKNLNINIINKFLSSSKRNENFYEDKKEDINFNYTKTPEINSRNFIKNNLANSMHYTFNNISHYNTGFNSLSSKYFLKSMLDQSSTNRFARNFNLMENNLEKTFKKKVNRSYFCFDNKLEKMLKTIPQHIKEKKIKNEIHFMNNINSNKNNNNKKINVYNKIKFENLDNIMPPNKLINNDNIL